MTERTRENPLTREQVIALIKANGGPKGLDLSRRTFEQSIDLSNLYLVGIVLDGADLSGICPAADVNGLWVEESPETRGAHLEGADLFDASLKGTMLSDVHLEGADLSHAHLEDACLWHAHLSNANLTGSHLDNADLKNADLTGARLLGAHLRNADLSEAQLAGAVLSETDLEQARLYSANLEGADLAHAKLGRTCLEHANLKGTDLTATDLVEAYLEHAKFDSDTRLESANWGDHILPEEKRGEESKGEERRSWFSSAATNYRRLKIWYSEHGMYDMAGEFFYREMEAKRKAQTWKAERHLKLWNWVLRLLCGYGERPLRVVLSSILILLAFGMIYFFSRGVAPYNFTLEALSGSLYYSAISFTALGYGLWVSTDSARSWIQWLGVGEAFLGIFMMALFLITFTRKMTR